MKIKVSSETQKEIVKELNESKGAVFVGYVDSRKYKAAVTLEKNNPEILEMRLTERAQEKISKGQPGTLSYDLVKKKRHECVPWRGRGGDLGKCIHCGKKVKS